MPSKTFENLSRDKRVRILRAAKKEFSRVPVDKAVIANIVKDARIPRGSFYQYFSNVDDLFSYLVAYMYGIDKHQYESYLSECQGDVYEALKKKFSHVIDRLMIEENRQFRINVAQMMYRASRESVAPADEFNLYYFPDEVHDEPREVMNVLKMVTRSSVTEFITNTKDPSGVKAKYNQTIDFIKAEFEK